MLSKRARLSRTQFEYYFKVGKRFQSSVATLIVASSPTFHGAVVVSKKVSKKAVVRNTLRRRVYAQLYQTFEQRGVTQVCIVILKPPFAALSSTAAREALRQLIELAPKPAYNSSHV